VVRMLGAKSEDRMKQLQIDSRSLHVPE